MKVWLSVVPVLKEQVVGVVELLSGHGFCRRVQAKSVND